MADDIVTRLRELMADLLYNPDCDDEGCGDCAWHRIGADAIAEIERLRAERDEARAEASMKGYRLDDAADEIERLRVAGDALALSIETFVPGVLAHISIKQAFSDWQEARRG